MCDIFLTKVLTLLVLATLLMTGCSDGEPPPANLLPEDHYIDLMVELQLLESYRYAHPGDSLVSVDSLKRVIFEKYGTTEQEFITSHEYYRKQLEEQDERITGAIDRLLLEDSRLREAEEADTPVNR